MTPTECGLSGIFEQTRRYQVPLFQRGYVWGRPQLERLWEMIGDKVVQRLSGNRLRPRFLGTIVLAGERATGTSLRSDLVIDGQQRLTTIALFLAALRDWLHTAQLSGVAGQLERLTANYVPMDGNPIEKYKVWPTEGDQAQFRACMDLPAMLSPEARALKASTDKGLRLVQAYNFFYSGLDELFQEQAATHSREAVANALFTVLLNDLRVVTIDLGDHDDPQEIFEVLNYGGEPLSPSDLLRNWALLRCHAAGLDLKQAYQRWWARFDRAPWNEVRSIGRLNRLQVDVFVNHYLQAQEAEAVNVERLYGEYRDWSARQNFESIEAELQQLNTYAETWEALRHPSPDSVLGRFAELIQAFEVGALIPAILYLVHEARVDDVQLGRMHKLFESYVVRRALASSTTKNYNNFLVGLVKTFRERGATPEVLYAALTERSAASVVWPSDATMANVALERPLYEEANKPRLQWILWEMETALRTSRTERLPKPDLLSIEHCLPQGWREHWSMPNGERARSASPDEINLSQANIDPQLQLEAERDRLLHSLGNLTLVTQPLNSSLSNSGFSRKREELERHSLLLLNREIIAKQGDWSEADIRARGSRMLLLFLARFPLALPA